jgi:hypothetical protein
MNKQSSSQKKILQVKVHAHVVLPGKDKLGPHALLGYAQIDLAEYVGKKK